jgi:hypothetical protein
MCWNFRDMFWMLERQGYVLDVSDLQGYVLDRHLG